MCVKHNPLKRKCQSCFVRTALVWMGCALALLCACDDPNVKKIQMQNVALNRAKLHCTNADYGSARLELDRAIKNDEKDYRPYLMLSYVIENESLSDLQLQSALAYAQKALMLEPKSFVCNMTVGRLLSKMAQNRDDFKEAATYLERATDLPPPTLKGQMQNLIVYIGSLEKIDDPARIAVAAISLGGCYEKEKEYASASRMYLLAAKNFKKSAHDETQVTRTMAKARQMRALISSEN